MKRFGLVLLIVAVATLLLFLGAHAALAKPCASVNGTGACLV